MRPCHTRWRVLPSSTPYHIAPTFAHLARVKVECKFIPILRSISSRTEERSTNTLPIDLHIYTSGRYLRHDTQQRQVRHVKFDFQSLCDRAIKCCPGANAVTHYEKKEGSFNRVFLLQMDSGQKVAVKIPFQISGPPRLATQSEVATIAYLRKVSTVPVLKVLDWNDDCIDPTGTEFIMEHANGINLNERWPSMETPEHMLCVKDLTEIMAEMYKLKFPAFGSIYFADVPIDSDLKVPLAEGFCIGPHCGRPAWSSNHRDLDLPFYKAIKPNRGPWHDLCSYCSGMIATGYACIPESSSCHTPTIFEGTIEERQRLQDISDKITSRLVEQPVIQNVGQPMLLHPDLHKRNIFVAEDNPSKIVTIIDWQGTCVDPIFMFDETPDLILPPSVTIIPDPHESARDLPQPAASDGLSGRPEEIKGLKHSIKESPIRTQKWLERDLDICHKGFDVMLWSRLPVLRLARKTYRALLRSIYYSGASRRSSADFQDDLIEVSRRWSALGLPGTCPYQPPEEEIAQNAKDLEEYQTYKALRETLSEAVGCQSDGRVAVDEYDRAKEELKETYRSFLEVAEQEENEIEREKAKRMWPFDVD